MFIRQPDHTPIKTPELHAAIRAGKVKALHALIKKGVFVEVNGTKTRQEVYADGTAFDLAKIHMPEQVPVLREHMVKNFYGGNS